MASVLIRGLARACPRHPLALQQFYTTRPSPKPTSSDTSSPLKSSVENEKSTAPPTTTTTAAPVAPASPPSPLSPQNTSDANTERPNVGAVEQSLSHLKSKIEESQRKAEHVRDDIRGYALNRFINYIKNYEQVLEKKFPGAMRVYRVFMDGVKFFGRDMMEFVKIRSKMLIGDKDIDTLTRRELELFYQMPYDMRKVGPIIFISAIPFAHYITMPIAYMYPRHFLTHHFWTLQQRSEFAVMNLRDRLSHNRPVLRYLQSNMSALKNDRHFEQWRDILGKLGSGLHPTVDDIIGVEELFSEPPYKTRALCYSHVKHLAGLHGIQVILTRKSRLTNVAMCLHQIDMVIKREGGASNLSTEILRDSCFRRGLNASNLPNEELSKFLDDWILVSEHINPKNFSLFLHLPILMAYNHPNNWKLIYQER